MWRYSQTSGQLSQNGAVVATGYSGHGPGLNDPAEDGVEGEGPIPRGTYAIGAPRNSAKVGPFAMPLTALPGTDTHGRSAFLMHGDNSASNHSASHGCLIFARPIRARVWTSGDHTLEVVA